jgi:TatD DNase family protein
MIDTHCHIDQFADPLKVARAADRAGVTTIAVTSLPSHFEAGRPHVASLRRVRLALGLHPLLAAHHGPELRRFESNFPLTSYIGEVGLDFSKHGKDTKDQQLKSFRLVLELVTKTPKFLTLHSRGAERVVQEMLCEYRVSHGVFHWFSGSASLAAEIAAEGFYFSINPAMVRSQSGKQIIEILPPEKVLTETDGPYVVVRNRPAVPADVEIVLRYLAECWNVATPEAEAKVRANFRAAISPIRARTDGLAPLRCTGKRAVSW